MDSRLLLSMHAIFWLFVCFAAFKYGYKKHSIDQAKERKRIWQEQEKKLPKALKK